MTRSDHQHWMDALRGFAIFMVIYHHGIGQAATISDVPEVLLAVDRFFDPFRMPALIMLSGMLLKSSLAKPRGAFLGGKVRRVLWPYLVWSLLVVTAVGLAGQGVRVREFAEILFDPPTYLWFLAFLFVYYMLALCVPPSFHPWIVMFGWASSFVSDNLVIPGLLDNVSNAATSNSERFTYLLGFFFAGQELARRRLTFDRLTGHPACVVAAIAVTLAGGLLSVSGVLVTFNPVYAAVPLAGFVVMFKIFAKWKPRYLQFIGTRSLVFYVSHFLVIMVVSQAASRIGIDSWVFVTLLLLLAPIVAGLVGVAAAGWGPTAWLFALPAARSKRREPQSR